MINESLRQETEELKQLPSENVEYDKSQKKLKYLRADRQIGMVWNIKKN